MASYNMIKQKQIASKLNVKDSREVRNIMHCKLGRTNEKLLE
jgi:aspartate carbamoyltransferase regulatory subunit